MTDNPIHHSTEGHTGPEDKRGLQPGLILTGAFGAIIGLGAVLVSARAASRPGKDRTPSGP